ncbi:tol-pal system-associated acyl-CoA thioesterase [Pontibaca methylaminivorans]|uniref:Acyl-CoA thioester hydrolase n=1 Tax=Pontibaca methylaminivorans TaxID=515897 RepID=A0A1R3WBF0_9RHOB|nr:tol-pal system-associated acyl-CoA thioesterase [Pontibaca methylaminivorans]SIT74339.1 acyl-CoA thioester hydrolase [Pontibaca methylaminivorans]
MKHLFKFRVYYDDTDMGAVVYHANYLRFIERARSDWVRALGSDQNAMRESGILWVVRRIEADYLAPARFDDLLEVETVPVATSGVRFVLDQTVSRGGRALFRARVTLACMSPDGRPLRLPAEIRAIFG